MYKCVFNGLKVQAYISSKDKHQNGHQACEMMLMSLGTREMQVQTAFTYCSFRGILTKTIKAMPVGGDGTLVPLLGIQISYGE